MHRISKLRKRFSGWRSGVMLCAITTGVVFILNAIFTICALVKHETDRGVSDIYVGSCSKVPRMDAWLHFAINAASTVLLSASNYTMQIISSPTREEVDKAHKRHDWLDIGIPSVRNVRRISWIRIAMWWALGLSSVPLHLMYNSVVYSSIAANPYQWTIVQENFLDEHFMFPIADKKRNDINPSQISDMQTQASRGALAKYSVNECRKAYAVRYATKVGELLLVTSDTSISNESYVDGSGSWAWDDSEQIPYYWTCGDGYSPQPYKLKDGKVCTAAIASSATDRWTVNGHSIEYCMVEETPESCKLGFNSRMMIFVLVANFVKCIIMVLTLWRLKAPTLVTVGDGVSSFLQRPDKTTIGVCLNTNRDFIRWADGRPNPSRVWNSKSHSWFESASIKRWVICHLLSISAIGVGIYLLRIGMRTIGTYDVKRLYDLGFGTVNGNSIIHHDFFWGSRTVMGFDQLVLIANSPQVLLSVLYLNYNGLFSCVVANDEWSRFAHSRKPLRVTSPAGQQRSTYFLSLPYRYAIPLMIMSVALHWLASQSLFIALVYASPYTYSSSTPLNQTFSVGYSCIAIFCALILGGVIVLFGNFNGFRRYPPGMPIVGSCSAAISAACHPPAEDTSAAFKSVKWGVVEEGIGDNAGHCTFSSFEVTKPIEGKKYE